MLLHFSHWLSSYFIILFHLLSFFPLRLRLSKVQQNVFHKFAAKRVKKSWFFKHPSSPLSPRNRKFSRCQKAVRMALELRFISDCQRSCDPSRENTAGFYDTCVISGKFFKKMKFELSKIGDFFFFSSLLPNNRESSRTNKFERSIQNDRFRCLYRVSNFYFV